MKSFGAALLGFIAASRFRSQRQFALAIGMEPTYLNRIVKGNVQRPDPETLQKMAEALGVDYARLLELAGYPPNGNGDPKPEPAPAQDRRWDVSEAVAYVESLKGRTYRERLFALRQERTDEEWVTLCMGVWRVQLVSVDAVIQAYERLGGRNNNG